jgi:lysophospholipase L1-like esterase
MAASAVPLRFLALGDSYTIGEGVAADERWPAQLARRLSANGVAVATPEVVAQTGWTTDELSAAMDAAALTPPYDFVTLLIGVNNQYRGRALENYREEFAALLARAIALAGTRRERVVVVSIPDWGVTRFARNENRDTAAVGAQIDAFNAAAAKITAATQVAYVDVTAASRESGDHDAMLVSDGLHPSAAQYALWTDAVFTVARDLLKSA